MSATGELAETNPFRYRGYYYDAETGFYYLQSRYYDPAIGRFINADGYASTGQDFLGFNMFAYCLNNPIMYSDFTGCAPKWWQWVVSGAAVVGGVILTATGVGGVAGGALIAAGANSIIGAYTNEAAGGSTTAGWVGGAVAGAINGATAGIAGNVIYNGLPGLSGLAKGAGIAFTGGVGATFAGSACTSIIDGASYDIKSDVASATGNGIINIISSFGATMTKMLNDSMKIPGISTNSVLAAGTAATVTAIITEVGCDTVAYIYGNARTSTSRWTIMLN